MKKGMLIVISAPAGCGKDTIIDNLLKVRETFPNGLFYSVSATTRQKRDGEIDGIHYCFKTRDEFERLIKADEFLEWTEYCGNYYGTLKHTVVDSLNESKNIVLKIEVEGAAKVIKMFPGCLSIFILPPDLTELRRRLRLRGTDDEATIDKRIERAVEELHFINDYRYRIVNDKLERAIEEAAQILRKELTLHYGKQ